MLKHIATSRSDHCLIFLDLEKDRSVRTATWISRYEIMWEREESLPSEIKQARESSERPMQNPGDIADTLHNVMASLMWWSKEKFGAVTEEIAMITKKHGVLSLQDPVANQGKLGELTKHMDELLYQEKMMLKDQRRRPEGVNGRQSKFLEGTCPIS
jgi:hypothetical protein